MRLLLCVVVTYSGCALPSTGTGVCRYGVVEGTHNEGQDGASVITQVHQGLIAYVLTRQDVLLFQRTFGAEVLHTGRTDACLLINAIRETLLFTVERKGCLAAHCWLRRTEHNIIVLNSTPVRSTSCSVNSESRLLFKDVQLLVTSAI